MLFYDMVHGFAEGSSVPVPAFASFSQRASIPASRNMAAAFDVIDIDVEGHAEEWRQRQDNDRIALWRNMIGEMAKEFEAFAHRR